MTSLINAVRNITVDNYWYIKLVFLSCLPYLLFDTAIFRTAVDSQSFIIFTVATACILIGVSAFLVNAVINNKLPSLPGVKGFFSFFIYLFVAPLLILPALLTGYYAFNYAQPFFHNFDDSIVYVLNAILVFLFIPFAIIPVVLFCVRQNPLDAFRLNIVFKSAGNFIIESLSFVIQYALLVFLPVYLIYLAISNIPLYQTIAYNILYSVSTTFTVLLIFSYSAEMYGSSGIAVLPESVKKTSKN